MAKHRTHTVLTALGAFALLASLTSMAHSAESASQKSFKSEARRVLARMAAGDSHALGGMISSNGLDVVNYAFDEPAVEAEKKRSRRSSPPRLGYDLDLSTYGSEIWDQEDAHFERSELNSADFRALIHQFQGLVENSADGYKSSLSLSLHTDDRVTSPPGPGLCGKLCAGYWWYIFMIQENGHWKIGKMETVAH